MKQLALPLDVRQQVLEHFQRGSVFAGVWDDPFIGRDLSAFLFNHHLQKRLKIDVMIVGYVRLIGAGAKRYPQLLHDPREPLFVVMADPGGLLDAGPFGVCLGRQVRLGLVEVSGPAVRFDRDKLVKRLIEDLI